MKLYPPSPPKNDNVKNWNIYYKFGISGGT